MLQHNNNNNHPCLDVAHRELLHGCRRNGNTFSSALGFSAIPLIKGLRAWAVNGGYSRSKRKTVATSQASDLLQPGRTGPSHRKTHSFHTAGARQGGLGALVTVATLKKSDGGRQTQTQCLFLKAEGCNYVCALGSRVDGSKPGKASQDGMGISDGKPVRKWRKSSKRPKSIEDITLTEDKEGLTSSKLLEKCSITQCLKVNAALTTINNDEDHLNKSEFSTLHEVCEPSTCSTSTKYDSSTEVKENTTLACCPELSAGRGFVGQISSISISGCTHKMTEIMKHESDLTTAATLNQISKPTETDPPNSDKCGPVSEVDSHNKNRVLSTIIHLQYNSADTINYETDFFPDRNLNKFCGLSVEESKQHGAELEDTSMTDGTLLNISPAHCEGTVITSTLGSHSATLLLIRQEKQEIKDRKDDDGSFNREMENTVCIDKMKEDMTSPGNNQDMDRVCEPAKIHCGSPACSSCQKQKINIEVNMRFKDGKRLDATNEAFEACANSFSQGSDAFIAANTITTLANLDPTTNPPSLRSISRQQQEESEGMRLAVQPAVELLEKQGRVQDAEKVEDEGSEVVEEENGDEFGVFMKAGDEQVWHEGFNELKNVPCEKQAGFDIKPCCVSNETSSWRSDWTRDMSIKKSEDTWTFFKQDVLRTETEKACWFSTAMENMHQTQVSPVTVPNVFLEAFPYLKSSCEDSDRVPTLGNLLRISSAEKSPEINGQQSLLDGLQDLDRIIGVKYKVAESLSRKILLQSLNLRTRNPELAGDRKQNMPRFSPNLPSSNQHLAANAKRRLSYDINRNILP